MDEEKLQVAEVTKFVEKDFLISDNNSLIPSDRSSIIGRVQKISDRKTQVFIR